CGLNCAAVFPNALTSCNGAVCQFQGCQPGFWNLDGNLANGCEYACNFQSSTDLPDNGFVDANCDGVDGDASRAIFVSADGGSDSNLGTMQQPMLTIMGGINKAIATSKNQVYISEGTYNEKVTLSNGISLYGGYSKSNGWVRSTSFITTVRAPALVSG